MTARNELMCPRCDEDRLTEIIVTGRKRIAVCMVCCFEWPYQELVCTCGNHPAYDIYYPNCPRCGKQAQMTKPT